MSSTMTRWPVKAAVPKDATPMPISMPSNAVVIRIGQAGRRAGHKVSALAVEQQDAAQHVRLLLLHAQHDGLQYRGQRRAMGQQFQHMIAVLFALLGKFALGEVARHPAPDAQDVEDGGDDAG